MSASILSNTFIASIGRVVSVLLGLIVTIIVSRYFGPDTFGLYSLLLAYGAILHILADFGLYLTLTRDISQHPDRESFFISHITTMRLVLVVGIFLLGIAVAFFVPALRPLWFLLVIASIGYIAQSMSQLLMGIYQKYGLMWRVTIGDLVGRVMQVIIISVVLLVVIDKLEYGVDIALMSVVLAFSLGALSSYFLHRLLLPINQPFKLTFDWLVWKDIAGRAWPLGVMLVVNAIYFRIDIVVLSFFRSAEEVGLYGLAYKVVESSLFFPAMFGGLVLPKLSALVAGQDKAGAQNLLREGIHFLLAVGTLTLVLLTFLSTPLLVMLSGESFAAAGPILQILSGALFVMFLGNLFGFALVSLQRQKSLLLLYVVLAVLNVVANILFIPFYGAAAAAWTTVGTEALAAIVAAYLVWKEIKYRIDLYYLGKVVVIASATSLVIVAMPNDWHVVLQGMIAVAVYAGLAFVIGLIRSDRLVMLLSSK